VNPDPPVAGHVDDLPLDAQRLLAFALRQLQLQGLPRPLIGKGALHQQAVLRDVGDVPQVARPVRQLDRIEISRKAPAQPLLFEVSIPDTLC
jgi:hypothetical protein